MTAPASCSLAAQAAPCRRRHPPRYRLTPACQAWAALPCAWRGNWSWRPTCQGWMAAWRWCGMPTSAAPCSSACMRTGRTVQPAMQQQPAIGRTGLPRAIGPAAIGRTAARGLHGRPATGKTTSPGAPVRPAIGRTLHRAAPAQARTGRHPACWTCAQPATGRTATGGKGQRKSSGKRACACARSWPATGRAASCAACCWATPAGPVCPSGRPQPATGKTPAAHPAGKATWRPSSPGGRPATTRPPRAGWCLPMRGAPYRAPWAGSFLCAAGAAATRRPPLSISRPPIATS